MKTPKSLYSRLALITSITLVVGYFVVYAVYTNIDSAEVAPSAIITSTLMGKIKTNFDDISTRVTTLEGAIAGASVWSKVGSDINYTAGNVGVGTSSPTDKLHIFSDMTSGGVEPYFTIEKTHPSTYLTRYLTKYSAFGLDTILPAGTSGSAMIRVTGGDQSVGGGGISFKTNGDNARMFIHQDGNVGIGTTTPVHKLHIYSASTSALVMDRPVGFFGGYQVRTSNSPRWVFGADATVESGGNVGSDFQFTAYTDAGAGLWNAMTIQRSTGNIGIGVLSPTYKLQVNGQPAANGYTAFVNYSDRRLKENVSNITDGSLEKILKLRPVEYSYNNKYFSITGYDKNTKDKKLRGFIAQELKEVFPEMVGEKPFGDEKYLDTDLSNLQIYMVKAIQELNAKNLKLEKEIQELKNK